VIPKTGCEFCTSAYSIGVFGENCFRSCPQHASNEAIAPSGATGRVYQILGPMELSAA
jgi:hypothetical protein